MPVEPIGQIHEIIPDALIVQPALGAQAVQTSKRKIFF
jgi:hypothetical protein